VIDGQNEVRELRAGVSQATYLTGITGPCYRRDDIAGTIRWYLYDGLGSVLGEVDPNGTITATWKYDVYGAVRSSTGTSTSKHKFVGSLGHPSEDETGLIFMRARYMDPAVGRFISEDPGRDGANWFDYASGNPVTREDPSGRIALPPELLQLFQSFLDPIQRQELLMAFEAGKLSLGQLCYDAATLIDGGYGRQIELGAAELAEGETIETSSTIDGAGTALEVQGGENLQVGLAKKLGALMFRSLGDLITKGGLF
jgi:RHS repeat-associated protein